MGAISFYEEEHYPPGEDGRADTSQAPMKIDVMTSNFHGDDQIYFRIFDEEGKYKTLHLTKPQASQLASALESCVDRIGYDNT